MSILFKKRTWIISIIVFMIVSHFKIAKSLVSSSDIASHQEYAIASQSNEPRRRWFCGFFRKCESSPPREDGNSKYCDIAPNGYSIYMWRERPIFVFFDYVGHVQQINLYRRSSQDNSNNLIWSYPIPAETNAENTLHIIHPLDNNLSVYQAEDESWQTVTHTSENIPRLESEDVYYYKILTTEDIDNVGTNRYFGSIQFKLLPEDIRTRIQRDINEIQINSSISGDELYQAIVQYFFLVFEDIARTEFPEFFENDKNGFLLDNVYQLLTMPSSFQQPYIDEIVEYCKSIQREES